MPGEVGLGGAGEGYVFVGYCMGLLGLCRLVQVVGRLGIDPVKCIVK